MKKVGLAIGGGAAWSASSIGIIQVLQENNIKIDYLAGTSMGAIIAAAYSSQFAGDQTLEKIEELLKNINFDEGKVRNRHSSFGFYSPEKIGKIFEEKVGRLNFEDLTIPLSIVATDFKTGEQVIFEKGPVTPAIIASAAFPWLFQPLEYQGRLLTDGWLSNMTPVDVVKDMGAEIVIGIDVASKNYLTRLEPKKEKLRDKFIKLIPPLHYWTSRRMKDTLVQIIDLLSNNMNRYKLALNPPDILLAPHVTHHNQFLFHLVPEHIKEGRRVMEEKLAELKKKIKN